MAKRLGVVVAVLIVVSVRASMPDAQVSGIPTCLHNSGEREADRVRREGAIALAKAINQAQGMAVERTRVYAPLAQLRNLPPTPRGFDLRLYTDAVGYVVSLKDTLDPCRYAIFIDQAGFVYEKAPLDAPLLAEESR